VRLRLDLAYEGTEFSGWAAQPGLRTVQGTLEGALAMVLRLPAVAVTCAGRTDAGVHARGQVVHADVDVDALVRAAGRSSDPPVDALVRRLNGVLPADVRLLGGAEAAEGFDARFSALWRRYAYRVADAPGVADPLTRRTVLTWSRRLDVDSMAAAAAYLLGEHDFAAFCRRREGATTVRHLLELRPHRDDRGLVVTTARADAFCHSMVRALMGCLVAVGEGRREPSWARQVLSAGVRDPAVPVLPPHGLTLEEVAYPPDDELEARAALTRRVRLHG